MIDGYCRVEWHVHVDRKTDHHNFRHIIQMLDVVLKTVLLARMCVASTDEHIRNCTVDRHGTDFLIATRVQLLIDSAECFH